MPPVAAPPLVIGLAVAFALGVLAGAVVNWAVYWLAYRRRAISPWSPPPAGAPPRRVADRLPVLGWIGLRRERALHGAGFWIRPLVVELLLGASWAAMYWWEVDRQGLIVRQVEALLVGPLPIGVPAAPFALLLATFVAHALLIGLMAAASLIDIDEKTIPDSVTLPGTLLALALATVSPASLLPHVDVRFAPPDVGTPLQLPLPPAVQAAGGVAYLEPLSLVAPNQWPESLQGAPNWRSLVIGLGCYAVWIFALTPRIWRGRRGVGVGLSVMSARVARSLMRRPLAPLALVGVAAITAVWGYGGGPWLGLLTALVGMVGGGGLVWAVRIVGSAAMRREAMGFGDVTLMMMIGAFLGWQPSVLNFFIAPFAGLVVGVLQLILRRDDVIPYGPFLCLGALAVMIRWADFWNAESSVRAMFEWPWLVPAVMAVGVVLLGAMLVIWRNIKEAIFRREA